MFVIKPVTAQQISLINLKLQESGAQIVPVAPNQYQVTGHGITANGVFDGNDNSLTVTVIHKPFYVPESAIQNALQDAIKSEPEPYAEPKSLE